jgi:hypothetical protein
MAKENSTLSLLHAVRSLHALNPLYLFSGINLEPWSALYSRFSLIPQTSTDRPPHVEVWGSLWNQMIPPQIPPVSGIWWNQMIPPPDPTRSHQIPPDPTNRHAPFEV